MEADKAKESAKVAAKIQTPGSCGETPNADAMDRHTQIESAASNTQESAAATASGLVEALEAAEPTSDRRKLDASRSSRASTPVRKHGKAWLLASLWIVSAAAPALVVWQMMRTGRDARCVAVANVTSQYRARIATNITPPDPAPPTEQPTPSQSSTPPTADGVASAEAPTSSGAPASGSAAPGVESTPPGVSTAGSNAAVPAAAISTGAVVVQTESSDRVSIVLRSKPENAKVIRRGKEIGRTPLTIQIGRGEHRVFEVAAYGFGAKRITVSGDKPEILVNMLPQKIPH